MHSAWRIMLLDLCIMLLSIAHSNHMHIYSKLCLAIAIMLETTYAEIVIQAYLEI